MYVLILSCLTQNDLCPIDGDDSFSSVFLSLTGAPVFTDAADLYCKSAIISSLFAEYAISCESRKRNDEHGTPKCNIAAVAGLGVIYL